MQLTLNKFLLNEIQQLYRSTKCQYKLGSRFGKWLNQHYGDLLTVKNHQQSICMDISQKRRLYDELCQDFDVALLNCEIEQLDRLQMSAIHFDEKLSVINPNDNYVLVKWLTSDRNAVTKNEGSKITFQKDLAVDFSRRQSLRVPIDELDLNSLTQVLVVENQAVFDNIHLALLPAEIKNCLCIYRGNDQLSTGCYRLLKILSKHTQVIGFCDYDPAGIEILLTLPNISHGVFPIKDEQLFQKNNQQDFLRQSNILAFLDNNNNPALYPHIENIKANKLSLKQEHMLALATTLELVVL
ncbi:hypothetical protein A9Q98_09615 [Thalassotalea sp. 42_200_T64]|nr:hypothetical protein A9Q98_09615 [Thalassotalea sp. 42_200_T64]